MVHRARRAVALLLCLALAVSTGASPEHAVRFRGGLYVPDIYNERPHPPQRRSLAVSKDGAVDPRWGILSPPSSQWLVVHRPGLDAREREALRADVESLGGLIVGHVPENALLVVGPEALGRIWAGARGSAGSHTRPVGASAPAVLYAGPLPPSRRVSPGWRGVLAELPALLEACGDPEPLSRATCAHLCESAPFEVEPALADEAEDVAGAGVGVARIIEEQADPEAEGPGSWPHPPAPSVAVRVVFPRVPDPGSETWVSPERRQAAARRRRTVAEHREHDDPGGAAADGWCEALSSALSGGDDGPRGPSGEERHAEGRGAAASLAHASRESWRWLVGRLHAAGTRALAALGWGPRGSVGSGGRRRDDERGRRGHHGHHGRGHDRGRGHERGPAVRGRVAVRCERTSRRSATFHVPADRVGVAVRWLSRQPETGEVTPVARAVATNRQAGSVVQAGVASPGGDWANTAGSSVATDPSYRPFWVAGLSGDGHVVGMGDAGLDVENCFFYDPSLPVADHLSRVSGGTYVFSMPGHRKLAYYSTNFPGTPVSGHGTHVAGSLAGSIYGANATNPSSSTADLSNSASTAGGADLSPAGGGEAPPPPPPPPAAWGSSSSASLASSLAEVSQFSGLIPDARLAFVDLTRTAGGSIYTPGDLSSGLFDSARDVGASVHSDSWGAASIEYDQLAVQVDEYVWDNPSFLPVFAAGNAGLSAGSGDVAGASTVTSPATAKNCISVGATQAAGETVDATAPTYSIFDAAVAANTGESQLLSFRAMSAAFGDGLAGIRGQTLALSVPSPADACETLVAEGSGSADNTSAPSSAASAASYASTPTLLLIVRGNCSFVDKVANAQASGAAAALIYDNELGGYFVIASSSTSAATDAASPSSASSQEETDSSASPASSSVSPTANSIPTLPAGSITRRLGQTLSGLLLSASDVTVVFEPISSAPDGFDNLADYSSQGPTTDGRVKPDLVAPGSLVSARSGDAGTDGTCGLAGMAGTSMATPLVAGSAVVVRQYLEQGFYPGGYPGSGEAITNSSAALVKAVLIAGAASLSGFEASNGLPVDPPPSFLQGFGRVRLDTSLPLAASVVGEDAVASAANQANTDAVVSSPSPSTASSPSSGSLSPSLPFRIAMVDSATLETGQKHAYCVQATGQGALTIALVWSDYPASALAEKALVNDLDLGVRAAGLGGTLMLGNGGSVSSADSPDRENNVETVTFPFLPAGAVSITIDGYSVSGGSGAQPYSLVANGAFVGTLEAYDPDAGDASCSVVGANATSGVTGATNNSSPTFTWTVANPIAVSASFQCKLQPERAGDTAYDLDGGASNDSSSASATGDAAGSSEYLGTYAASPSSTSSTSSASPSPSPTASEGTSSSDTDTTAPFFDWKTCTSPTTLDSLPDGNYTFWVRAVGEKPAFARSFYVDTTPPVISVDPVTPGSTAASWAAGLGTFPGDGASSSNPRARVSFSIADRLETPARCTLAGSGASANLTTPLLLAADGRASAAPLGEPISPCPEPVSFARLAPGSWTVELAATDAAGNAAEPASIAWTVTLDEGVSYARVSSGPEGLVANAAATFELVQLERSAVGDASSLGAPATAVCALAGPTELDASLSDLAWVDCPGGTYAYTDLADGDYVFLARTGVSTASLDATAAASSSSDAYDGTATARDLEAAATSLAVASFTVDTTPPVVTVDNQPAALSSSRNASVEFSVDDANASVTCHLYKGSTPIWQDTACSSPVEMVGLADGVYELRVSATDAAGNEARQAVAAFAVDTTPPTFSSLVVPRGAPAGSFEVTFVVADDGASEGSEADAQRADAAAPAPAPSPAASAASPPADGTLATNVTCRLLAVALLDASASLGEAEAATTPSSGAYASCSSPASWSGLAPGRWSLTIRAEDASGNEATTRPADVYYAPHAPNATIATGLSSGEILPGTSVRLELGNSSSQPADASAPIQTFQLLLARAEGGAFDRAAGASSPSPAASPPASPAASPDAPSSSSATATPPPPPPNAKLNAAWGFSQPPPAPWAAQAARERDALVGNWDSGGVRAAPAIVATPATRHLLSAAEFDLPALSGDPAASAFFAPPRAPGGAVGGAEGTTSTLPAPRLLLATSTLSNVTNSDVQAAPPSTLRAGDVTGDWANCSTPCTIEGLSKGDWSIQVRAVDVAGNVGDPTQPVVFRVSTSSGGLPTWAIAVIAGVGGAVALALASLLVFYCVRRRRRRAKPPGPGEGAPATAGGGVYLAPPAPQAYPPQTFAVGPPAHFGQPAHAWQQPQAAAPPVAPHAVHGGPWAQPGPLAQHTAWPAGAYPPVDPAAEEEARQLEWALANSRAEEEARAADRRAREEEEQLRAALRASLRDGGGPAPPARPPAAPAQAAQPQAPSAPAYYPAVLHHSAPDDDVELRAAIEASLRQAELDGRLTRWDH